jgi:putative hydrolase of the HAD superfamily
VELGRVTRAVLLDAMGTLVRLEPPVPRLRAALGARGIAVDDAGAARAMRAEIAHYRAHHDTAGTREGLDRLRRACAEVVRAELARPETEAEAVHDALLEAIAFSPYPEVPAALRALRELGCRLVVVSNWDVSLHDVLRSTGLAGQVDAAVTSAEHGAAKPDPALFLHALTLAGAGPEDALHAGDDLEADVAGAQSAGIRAVLVARDGPAPDGVDAVADLGSLVQRVRYRRSPPP